MEIHSRDCKHSILEMVQEYTPLSKLCACQQGYCSFRIRVVQPESKILMTGPSERQTWYMVFSADVLQPLLHEATEFLGDRIHDTCDAHAHSTMVMVRCPFDVWETLACFSAFGTLYHVKCISWKSDFANLPYFDLQPDSAVFSPDDKRQRSELTTAELFSGGYAGWRQAHDCISSVYETKWSKPCGLWITIRMQPPRIANPFEMCRLYNRKHTRRFMK